jgi:hypothetical protein
MRSDAICITDALPPTALLDVLSHLPPAWYSLVRLVCKQLLAVIDTCGLAKGARLLTREDIIATPSLGEWARLNGCPWDRRVGEALIDTGRLDVLRWMRANLTPQDAEACAWTAYDCALAATRGHLEMIKYLRENDCPWDPEASQFAARYGHLDVLRWIWNEGGPWPASVITMAASGGHIDILQWLHTGQIMCLVFPSVSVAAAANGRTDVLRWLHANGMTVWNGNVCAAAAANGHLETLQWLRANDCPWDELTCDFAVKMGHTEILKWAIANGAPR